MGRTISQDMKLAVTRYAGIEQFLEYEYVKAIQKLQFRSNPNTINSHYWDVYRKFREKFNYAYHWHKEAPLALYIHCLGVVRKWNDKQYKKAWKVIEGSSCKNCSA